MLLVAFWLVAGRYSAKPFKAFELTADDFKGFSPTVAGISLKEVPVTVRDEAEPNIMAYVGEPAGSPVVLGLRLVHGYNMPMCMKIKGYTVTPKMSDTLPRGVPMQLWQVVSSAGDTSIWVTTMIRSGDFSATQVDVCSMAFPRVDIPDDPNWVPRGLGWADLKHPVESLRKYFRARWNASRTDLLTFLRLRQPAWANEELLTYVTRSMVVPVTPGNEAMVLEQVVAGHAALLKELQRWRQATSAR